MTAARQLSQHFASVSSDSLPEAPMHEMHRLLLDFLGVAINGSQAESGRIAAEVVAGVRGAPQATLIVRGERIPAMHAAFSNAISEHSIEMDDVDDLALFHYGPPIVATALAVAEWQGSPGLDLLGAMLCGCEMMNRLSLATNPTLRNRGFHTTPTLGVFGATIAAGRLLGLDAAQLTSALGLAGAQASGLMEMYGPSMQKRVNPGPAARNGVLAAMLAQAGFTGADTILEGERGFGAAFADGIDLDALLHGLGTEVPVAVEYKAYSAARPIHNAIDGGVRFHRQGIEAQDVQSIVIARHPDWARYHLNTAPQTFHEAQVSLPYSTAIALIDGDALPPQYADDKLGRPDVVELISKIAIEEDDSLPSGVSCRLELTRTDGTRVIEQVDDARGSLGNPMTDADLTEKFTRLASEVLPADQIAQIADAVGTIESAGTVVDLISLCVAAQPAHAA